MQKKSKLIRVWEENAKELENMAIKNNMSLARAFDLAMKRVKKRRLEIKF